MFNELIVSLKRIYVYFFKSYLGKHYHGKLCRANRISKTIYTAGS